MQSITRILETCLCVPDLAAARKFYTEVLGLAVHAEQTDRHLFFRIGDQMLLLFDPKESSKPLGTIPPHGTQGAGHVCFAMRDEEFDAWRSQLESHGIPIESIHTWPQGGRSIYFRDPAGNSLEFASPRIWGMES